MSEPAKVFEDRETPGQWRVEPHARSADCGFPAGCPVVRGTEEYAATSESRVCASWSLGEALAAASTKTAWLSDQVSDVSQ